jgi:hypothetical protein
MKGTGSNACSFSHPLVNSLLYSKHEIESKTVNKTSNTIFIFFDFQLINSLLFTLTLFAFFFCLKSHRRATTISDFHARFCFSVVKPAFKSCSASYIIAIIGWGSFSTFGISIFFTFFLTRNQANG